MAGRDGDAVAAKLACMREIGVMITQSKREFLGAFNRRLGDPSGGTLFTLLHTLRQSPGVGVVQLAELVGVDTSAISRLAHRLRSDGLLDAERDPQDRRALRLALTARGAERLDELEVVFNEVASERLGDVALGDLELLVELMRRVFLQPRPEASAAAGS